MSKIDIKIKNIYCNSEAVKFIEFQLKGVEKILSYDNFIKRYPKMKECLNLQFDRKVK